MRSGSFFPYPELEVVRDGSVERRKETTFKEDG